MTDMTASPAPARAMATIKDGLAARQRREFRLKLYGLLALGFSFAMLALVFFTLISTGYKAFTQTHVTLDVFIDPEEVPVERLPRGGFDDVLEASLLALVPGTEADPDDFFSDGAQFRLRDMVVADPSLIGQTVSLTVPVSDPFDQLSKNLVDRATPEDQRRVNDAEIALFDALTAAGAISNPLNIGMIINNDSRFPELAGLRGALAGTFWVLVICFAISVPLGIGAAIYLEEFARKGRFSDFVEVNINNLAAVPSVVFGLLALSVFLGWFGMPRGAPIVGGMTLALMNLPTIIIATRAALKAVPPSIREAALGVGASKQQVVFGHVLPLAMPGILTGTIIAMAQAIGETAPLLLIGMNAFMPDAATSPFQAATTLPTQIFIWADSPERGFVSRTSAAILVLLAFLVLMNGLAIWLRRRFERKW
jgi:phosphate transport system permease protein